MHYNYFLYLSNVILRPHDTGQLYYINKYFYLFIQLFIIH
ncbi:MAG: hypothetical protein UZ08_BCD001002250 [Candidatus Parvibacillus calidus]|nr:MAG: hypothetical protein UZ08_BCD001002250 [Candidatus Parvibacillus calidus]